MTEPVAGGIRDGEGPGPDGGLTAPAPLIYVRATVHLPGGPQEPPLRPGDVVLVPVANPYIQDQLRAQTLVPLPAHMQPPVPHPQGDIE